MPAPPRPTPTPTPAPAPAPARKAEAPPSVEAAAVPAPVRADEPVTRKLMSGDAAPEAALTPLSPPPLLVAERPTVAAWAVAAASAVPTTAVATLSAASSPGVEALRRPGDALRTRDDREARERAAALAQLDAPNDDAQPVPTTAVAAFASASSPALERLRRSADALRNGTDRDRSTELAGLDAARQDSQQRAQRLEAARAEAARQAAARLELGRIESARLAQVQAQAQAQAEAEAEQREARLRAIGKHLDEERAKRDAERQRPDWAPARRGRLYSRIDANEALTQYGELWSRKLEFNQTFDMVREAARQPHTDPVVTVAVRSDGSVESVTFLRSSGVPALDDAVRRVVLSQERYPPFPPALLRDYDVVEIRRSWHFDSAIRLN
ncbi:MAG: TonB family protein [Burkholderiales bacterium]|nr:MAG: TonB family protein [Burkholderiales bacterium]